MSLFLKNWKIQNISTKCVSLRVRNKARSIFPLTDSSSFPFHRTYEYSNAAHDRVIIIIKKGKKKKNGADDFKDTALQRARKFTRADSSSTLSCFWSWNGIKVEPLKHFDPLFVDRRQGQSKSIPRSPNVASKIDRSIRCLGGKRMDDLRGQTRYKSVRISFRAYNTKFFERSFFFILIFFRKSKHFLYDK